MDLQAYRELQSEKDRIASLLALIPHKGHSALDIGARDGHLSIALTGFFDEVTALDLEKPNIKHANIIPVKGDVSSLEYPDYSFDLVFCTEVLEHIPRQLLERACSEITRVAKEYIIIGVPYRQDTRVGRTTCYTCGKIGPPWGHVNIFDEVQLRELFPNLVCQRMEFVGKTRERTNPISTVLLDFAGNPYGAYEQDECCIHCGNKLKPSQERNLVQKVCTKIAINLNRLQQGFVRSQPIWIHVVFKKNTI